MNTPPTLKARPAVASVPRARRPPSVSPPAEVAETPTLETLFHRAVDLAFFILDDRALAVEAAIEALAKLRVAVQAQNRRLAYLPKGRQPARPTRSRVITGEAHLLQRLVYIECERFERHQEEAGSAHDAQMVIRFVKHVARITLKRNSFYVVLGISRLLHRYSTADTMDLYSLVIQDPNRVRDAHYYRSRKKQLIEEIVERFGERLSLESGPRGERRFRTRTSDSAEAALVQECLHRFTPWDTACVVPDGLDRWSCEIPELLFEGGDADAEHPVEIHRIHAALDPECFARLTTALALPSPKHRLALPEFHMPTDFPPGGVRRPPSVVPVDEWARVRDRLKEDARGRARGPNRVLSILVDGVERAQLDLAVGAEAEVALDSNLERIEVRQAGGQVLALWLASADPASRTGGAVTLANGQEIAIRVFYGVDDEPALLRVTSRETFTVPAAWRAWSRLRPQIAAALPVGFPALAAAAAIAVATIASVPMWRPEMAPEGMLAVPPAPPSSGPPSSTGAPAPLRLRDIPVRPAVPLPSGAGEAPAARELTRGRSQKLGLSLAQVTRVFVDPLGDAAVAHALQRELAARLERHASLTVVARRSADAVLKGTVAEDGKAHLQLVNATGQIVWQTRRQTDLTDPATSAAAILDELNAARARAQAGVNANRPGR